MVQKRREEAARLLGEVQELYDKVKEKGEDYFSLYEDGIVQENFVESARNLAYYLALRNYDIRDLQQALVPLGISSLGRLENKTLPTLNSVLRSLASIAGEDELGLPDLGFNDFTRGQDQLEENVLSILGGKPKKRDIRIMVTIPTEASHDEDLVRRLIQAGMNVARINCAHDDKKTWKKMIKLIRRVAEEEEHDVRILMDIAGPKIRTDWIFTKYKKPKVEAGDEILLTRNFQELPIDFEGKVVVGSDIEPIFKALKVGDPVLIDDGSVEAEVIKTNGESFVLEVKKAKGSGVRIKAEKGLNFPETEFQLPVVTDKDREDMAFAVENSDIIGLSFIRDQEDIVDIQLVLEELVGEAAHHIPLLAKIETQQAVANLPEIIYTAASKNPFSIMIARGDLAVETGYARLAEVQQEILWIAEAADVPVVWGTQVMADMIDTGIPSRAEVTDAGEGAGADCVMINKGTYMVEAVEMLAEIFKRMRRHQRKKTPQLRSLKIANLDLHLPEEREE